MRRWALVVALVLLGLSSASPATAARGTARVAKLQVVRVQPFELRGFGFRPHERVRVSLRPAPLAPSRLVTASARGSFSVSFGVVALPRCGGYVVSAVGRSGTRAVLRAKPLCAPA